MACEFILKQAQVADGDCVVLYGSFCPDTANPPTGLRGGGFLSVAHTDTGAFTVTLKNTWAEYIHAWANLQHTSGEGGVVVGDISISSGTPTMKLRVYQAHTAADIAANANNKIHFGIVVRKTTATT